MPAKKKATKAKTLAIPKSYKDNGDGSWSSPDGAHTIYGPGPALDRKQQERSEAQRNAAVMIAARVHPKLQYGLRLLSRVQGGTIAEALEWAIQLALRRTAVGANKEASTLDVLVNRAWKAGTEPRRIYEVSQIAPDLLDFEERGAWNLVRRTSDLWRDVSWTYVETDDEQYPELQECALGEGIPGLDTREPKFDVIEKHWKTIRHAGVLLAKHGEIDKSYTLKKILSDEVFKEAGIDLPY